MQLLDNRKTNRTVLQSLSVADKVHLTENEESIIQLITGLWFVSGRGVSSWHAYFQLEEIFQELAKLLLYSVAVAKRSHFFVIFTLVCLLLCISLYPSSYVCLHVPSPSMLYCPIPPKNGGSNIFGKVKNIE